MEDEEIRNLVREGVLNSSSQIVRKGSAEWGMVGDHEPQLGITTAGTSSWGGGGYAPSYGGSSAGVSTGGGGGYKPGVYPSQYAQQQPTAPSGQPLAEWWKRLLALILDGLILGVPLAIIAAIVLAAAGTETTIDRITGEIEDGAGLLVGAVLLVWGLSIVANLVYYSVLNGSARARRSAR